MGEFQCYKFRTVNRSLSPAEKKEVDALSSRGHVTNTSATFIYNYSDFKHRIENVLEKYFDLALYFSNWGTKQLIFRLPKKLVNKRELLPYITGGKWNSHVQLTSKGDYYLLDLYFNQEDGGGWADEEDYNISNFESIYHDLLNGDYRSLYLLWASLHQLETYEEEEDQEKNFSLLVPDIPHNLGKLSASLQEFIIFFEINENTVSAVQSFSANHTPKAVNYKALLKKLSDTERIDWLSRLLKGEVRLEIALRKHLESLNAPTAQKTATTKISIAQIMERSALLEKEKKIAAVAAAQAAHKQKMEKLVGQEDKMWKEIYDNIALKNSKGYDMATSILKELKALAKYQHKSAAFSKKMNELKDQNTRRPALLSRWTAAGLIED